MKKSQTRGRLSSHTSIRFALGAVALIGLVSASQAQLTQLVSLAYDGAQGNGDSPLVGAKISADGRYVVFRSEASNLIGVGNDTNGYSDIFRRDLVSGATERISVDHDGGEIFGFDCNNPSVSADGRFVTFGTTADNVVPGDTNGFPDVFVRDTFLGTTTIASLADDESFGNERAFHSGISEDGNLVIFLSYASNLVPGASGGQVFVRNLAAGTTTLVSAGPGGVPGDGVSGETQISLSADGRYACFASNATNLVASDTNNQGDIFVRDMLLGTTARVSVSSTGTQGNGQSFSPTISGTGRYVTFSSFSTTLVTGDTNGQIDVFIRDTQTNSTSRVSVDSSNRQGNGRSGGSNDGWGACGVSDDGRFVAFQSSATNLIGAGKDKNNLQDVFLRDRQLGKTTLVSISTAGKPGNFNSSGPSMSASGLIMFCSYATNLIANDTNGKMDVFVRPAQ
ncbi:MAG: hypothetical protein M3R13_00570 [Armatimonadota bacterium]|nr:hypothetical protein [Armatimonadota bacterium]